MPISGNRPMIVKFNDTSTGDGLTYVWDFGDGQSSNQRNPQHTYLNAGEYTVTLTVANEYGSNTITDTVTVVQNPTGMQYFEDYDLNGDGTLNILDVQGWVGQGRQDIAAEVLDFVSGNKPMPPNNPSSGNQYAPGSEGIPNTYTGPEPYYYEDYDYNNDGGLNVLDASAWANVGRPDIADKVVKIITGQIPEPPHNTSGNSNSGCFRSGTSISMGDGIKNIEDVKVGDIVKTFNIRTDSVETSTVTETFVHENNTDGLFINVAAGIIRTTTNHPFYVNGDWVEAGNLSIGDKILHVDGVEHTINSIEKLPESQTVYNFEVDGTHNYFAEGYLVHNKQQNNPTM